MNYIPSPPSSPYLTSYSMNHTENNVICGACNKSLGVDWFCSDCHSKCTTCNRFLGQDEYCSRCWTFDSVNQQFFRKLNSYSKFLSYTTTSTFTGLPSPSNSTESSSTTTRSSEPKLLTRPFIYKF